VASALVAGGLIVACLAGEIAIRLVHPSASLWRFPNYIELADRPDPNEPTDLLRYDSVLGWAPEPGSSGILMHQPASFSADGLRNQNEGLETGGGPSVLAVGDSFTVGFAVKDDESWPAQLERTLGRRVLNGGVHGYGLDQAVLRAHRLAEKFQPGVVVLAFIADDIDRAGLSVKFSTRKPFFAVTDDGLELRNVPVPETPIPGPRAWPRRILGYSYLLDFTMRRLGADDLWYGDEESTGQDVDTIACRLMGRFADTVRRHSARGLVVVFPQDNDWQAARTRDADRRRTSTVLACAGRQGLQTLDTYPAFAAATASPRSLYVDWHLNESGNALAARLIARALQEAP
jgi:hypothetical protein